MSRVTAMLGEIRLGDVVWATVGSRTLTRQAGGRGPKAAKVVLWPGRARLGVPH
jgi:hypothetical protein